MYFENAKRHLSDPYELAKIAVFLVLTYFFAFTVLPAGLSILRVSHTIGSLNVTPAMRAEVVESLADNLSRHYLDADKAKKIAAELREAQRKGEFEDARSPTQFANRLSDFLYIASNDQHFRVVFEPEEIPEFTFQNFAWGRSEELSPIAWLIDRIGRYQAKFGVDEVSRLEAGTGYLKLDAFFRPDLAGEKYAAAMDALNDSSALIIDLRSNGGGSPESAALLASYFFDKSIHLSDIVAPRTGERRPMWTSKHLEGKRYGESRPVYILTSSETFSAAEDFAYTMQQLRRATIVGEVTRGGAHPVSGARLHAHFLVAIPVAESISPITRSNWEVTGVRPDIVVDSRYALDIATRSILARQPGKPAPRSF